MVIARVRGHTSKLKMFGIFLVLYIANVQASTFSDILCSSSATRMTGTFNTLPACARGCAYTGGCVSFFYDSTRLECYTVKTVLTSTDGCESKAGARYYVQQTVSDCYNFTQDDQDEMAQHTGELAVIEKNQCESYSFHIYTEGDNQGYRGCGDCQCCKRKGCTSGEPRAYSGTWSQTKSGRTCQRWDALSPHPHINDFAQGFPLDNSVSDAHNYCRDPDLGGGPWCYTVNPDVRWEFCGVPTCSTAIYMVEVA